jgi:ribosome biogenesis GTPase
MTGRIYKSTGSWYTVKTTLGEVYQCRIKGKFRLKGIKSTNPIAVGDIVDFELEMNNDTVSGIIHKIHDRQNYIVRKSVNLSKQTHIISANIDQVFLLITINNPPTLTSFIDRFLVTAEAYSIKTILLFNKIDAYDEETLLEVKYLAHVYRKIGYECIGVSAKTRKNVDKVKAIMTNKVSMFAGHSSTNPQP